MNTLDQINRLIKTTNSTDFRIQSYLDGNLLITGSFDFCYHHKIEIEFFEVSYISLPTYFIYPLFRNSTIDERTSIANCAELHEDNKVYCIEAETDSSLDKIPSFIVAETFEIREGTVYYYKRENLGDNEKIAPWIEIDT